MKQALKGYVCGLVTACLGIGVAAFAGGQWKSIDVLSNDIKVIADGKEITADNFLYQDTTYLPLRAVAEAVGREVTYDEKNNTAYIGKVPLSQISTTPGGAGSAVLPQGGGNAGVPLNTPRPAPNPLGMEKKGYSLFVRIDGKLYRLDEYFSFYEKEGQLSTKVIYHNPIAFIANGMHREDYDIEETSNPYYDGEIKQYESYVDVEREYVSPTMIKYTARYKDRDGNVKKVIEDFTGDEIIDLNEFFGLFGRKLKYEVDDENKLLILELAE